MDEPNIPNEEPETDWRELLNAGPELVSLYLHTQETAASVLEADGAEPIIG